MSTTYRDRVAGYLKARAGRWIDGNELAEVGGCYAWRSRVSDCRTELGMMIENRQRRVCIDRGEPDEMHFAANDFCTVSEYRYIPPQGPQELTGR